MLLANLLGALVVFVYAAFVVPDVPLEEGTQPQAVRRNAVALVVYLTSALVVGVAWSTWRLRPLLVWLRADRGPTDDERRAVLRAPQRQALVNGTLWAVGVAAFTALNLPFGEELARNVALATALGGIATCALGYLISGLQLRPLVGDVLDGSAPSAQAPRLQTRMLVTWAAGSGVPLVGVVLAVVVRDQGLALDGPVLFLAAAGLLFGGAMTAVTARSIAAPLRSVSDAVEGVTAGRTDVQVRVDDATELGSLQAGVNDMVAGLRERQQLEDLFGRQVGADVARQALEQGVRLGGESRHVAVLFVDVVGSTRLAEQRSAADVVELLNRFFEAVIGAVDAQEGFVNKFQGDAVLAVFGAPVPRADPARRALAAARDLSRRLSALEGLAAGIGVSAGPVVAGNVGAAQRYEYTVVGDAVNEASRLTDLAKQTERRLLASGGAVAGAGDAEAVHWRRLGSVRLRGRAADTLIFGPSDR